MSRDRYRAERLKALLGAKHEEEEKEPNSETKTSTERSREGATPDSSSEEHNNSKAD